MKKLNEIDKVPDSLRKDLDFLGQVHCPAKDRFSKAWTDFENRYNQANDPKLRGVVPMGGCGTDIYYNISTVEAREKFPAVVTDTGYMEFFTGDFLSRPDKLSWFSAQPLPEPVHPLFRNIDIQDPRGIFTIFGAMPYVLLVNHQRLKGRPCPRRINDLTKSEYRQSVGTGFAPDDISELLLMEIHKEQGDEGIRALAQNIGFTGRAPEMAANALGNREGCCVYFISWFFAHAVPKRDYLEIIWPEDGAALNPMYALFKKEGDRRQQACAEFLLGKELGGIMAKGWFTQVNAQVSHPVPENASFRWVGWDYLYQEKITERVKKIETAFYSARG
ncbi:MAG: ABC transporter substrate-binding protein [Treponema sp.]|jgi:ABC-type Fe3+ transport system substrate-binding protein|nr:ABC transporter substrate-binding protein [Treponema sp.]